jgi:hypothetical protein
MRISWLGRSADCKLALNSQLAFAGNASLEVWDWSVIAVAGPFNDHKISAVNLRLEWKIVHHQETFVPQEGKQAVLTDVDTGVAKDLGEITNLHRPGAVFDSLGEFDLWLGFRKLLFQCRCQLDFISEHSQGFGKGGWEFAFFLAWVNRPALGPVIVEGLVAFLLVGEDLGAEGVTDFPVIDGGQKAGQLASRNAHYLPVLLVAGELRGDHHHAESFLDTHKLRILRLPIQPHVLDDRSHRSKEFSLVLDCKDGISAKLYWFKLVHAALFDMFVTCSIVVNRSPHFRHSRRRRKPSWCGRESMTFVLAWHFGQFTDQIPFL